VKALLALVAFLVLVLAGAPAGAGPIEAHPSQGGLPMELVQEAGTFTGKWVVENRSDRAVLVNLELRDGSDLDPRLPPGFRVRFVGGDSAQTLKPGERREAQIEWTPPRSKRLHEVYGHVSVVADGDATPPVLGFHAALGAAESGLTGRALSLSLLVPLLAALALAFLRRRDPRPGLGRWIWIGAQVAQLALFLWAASRFDIFHTRFAGGEGLDLVERSRLLPSLGVEWFVGVDGVTLVLALAAAAFGSLAAIRSDADTALVHGPPALLFVAGLTGAVISVDLLVSLAFWLVVVVALVWALTRGADERRALRASALLLGLGFVLVALAVWVISGSANVGYLLDGSRAPRVFSLAELAHGGFVPRQAALFGAHPTKLAFVALFLGAALTLGVSPFAASTHALVTRLPVGPALLFSAGLPLLGLQALLRVGYAALPAGFRWAALSVAVFGLLSALYSVLVLLVEKDPRRFASGSANLASAMALIGIGSLTASGVQAAVVLLLSRGLVLAVVLGALEMKRRAGPRASFASALGVLGWSAAAFAPGTLTFIGFVSGVAGALPLLRSVAVATAFVAVLAAAACVRSHRAVFADAGERSDEASPAPERELTVAVTAALLLLGLGLAPRPLLRLIDSACLDRAELVNPPGALEIVDARPDSDLRVASSR